MLSERCLACNGSGMLFKDVLMDACPLCDDIVEKSVAPSMIEGLSLVENVLTIEEQVHLVEWLQSQLLLGREGLLPGNTMTPVEKEYEERKQSREMLQYGTYTHSNKVEHEFEVAPLPEMLTFVVNRLVERGIIEDHQRLDSCTCSFYDTDHWIPPHIDNPLFDRPICIVSLLSEQHMVMGKGIMCTNGQCVGASFGDIVRFALPLGSVVLLAGAAANVYEHAIPPVSEPRISLTFRKLAIEGSNKDIEIECAAARKLYRDSARARASACATDKPPSNRAELMAAKKAAKLEQSKRDSMQAGNSEMSNRLKKKMDKQQLSPKPDSSKVDDVGNISQTPAATKTKQKFCPKCPDSAMIESNSERQALPPVEVEHVQKVYNSVAREWHGTRYSMWPGVEDFIKKQSKHCLVADVGCGNGKNMPAVRLADSTVLGSDFSTGLIDICAERGLEVKLADALHLPYRSNAFDYALNIAVLHHISSKSRRVMLVRETMRVLRVGGTALFYAWAYEQIQGGVSGHVFEGSDVLVPFSKDAVVLQRYCHVYREGELAQLFEDLPWCKVERVYFDCGNWCVEVRKSMDPQPLLTPV